MEASYWYYKCGLVIQYSDVNHNPVVQQPATDVSIKDANHYAVVWKPATDIISVA